MVAAPYRWLRCRWLADACTFFGAWPRWSSAGGLCWTCTRSGRSLRATTWGGWRSPGPGRPQQTSWRRCRNWPGRWDTWSGLIRDSRPRASGSPAWYRRSRRWPGRRPTPRPACRWPRRRWPPLPAPTGTPRFRSRRRRLPNSRLGPGRTRLRPGWRARWRPGRSTPAAPGQELGRLDHEGATTLDADY